MEKKIKIIEKVLLSVFTVTIVLWSIIVFGLFSLNTIVLAVIMTAVLISRKTQAIDERDWQIYYISTYGAFLTTLCFLFIYQAVEYVNTGTKNPLAILTIGVLMLSQWVFTMVFRKSGKD